ncbi:MAG: ComEC/Rec2 family competence protein [Selenomonadaceae bacterium]
MHFWQNKIVLLLVAGLLLLSSGCSFLSANKAQQVAASPLLVKMLDVGQGDAILIRTAEQTVLIDSGDQDQQAKLAGLLHKEGIEVIDKLILTHPHADHIGGTAILFREFKVRAVYDNGQPTTTKLYRDYLKTVRDQAIEYGHLKRGDELAFGGGVAFKVLSPTQDMVKAGGEMNGNSIVGQLLFGSFSLLLTGDVEAEGETAMVKAYGSALKSDVLKAAHHGSKTSSSKAFLQAAAPAAVLISVGRDNEYGHPHKNIVNRYEKQQMKIYRTDQNGTITLRSDGKTYDIIGER